MKWLFFLLLLINIGLFVWIYPQQPPPQAVPTHLPGVKRLVLLSEVNPATADPGQSSETAHANGTELEMEVDIPSPQAASPGSEMPKQADDDPSAGFGAEGRREQPSKGVQPGPARECRKIGPLDKRGQADKLSQSLLAMGIHTRLQMESIDEQDGYWVMIPPQQNQEAAEALVKQLHAAGISDLWRFTSGSLAHAVSLGLFRHESRAESRREDIAAKGFDVEVRPRYRQMNTYWLDFSFLGDSPLSEADWKHFAEIFPGLQQRTVDCAALSNW